MTRYLIVIKENVTGFSAYSPDIPGCIATARTRAEVERQMQQALETHIRGLRLAGEEVPTARSEAAYSEVSS